MTKSLPESIEKYQTVSRMMKNLNEADEIIKSKIEQENMIVNLSGNKDIGANNSKTKDKPKFIYEKFTVLNQKASKLLKKLSSKRFASNTDLSIVQEYYHRTSKPKHKLPALKKLNFFDPSPLPINFKIKKNLISLY